MMRGLGWVRWGDSYDQLGYYSRFVKEAQRKGVTIVTVNYDNAVEATCAQFDIPCTLGVHSWGKKGRLSFQRDHLRLLKLHGSILWGTHPHTLKPANQWGALTVDMSAMEAGEMFPYVIFGDENKLSPFGPMLCLIEEFRRTLYKARRIVVVGYSFMDHHINYLLCEWMDSNNSAQMAVYDKHAGRVKEKLPDAFHKHLGRIDFQDASAETCLPHVL